MFGAFKPTNPLSVGLIWTVKIRRALSVTQKLRQRRRLRAVDEVISVLDKALMKQGMTTKTLERWKNEMPKEEEMVPKDKYSIFDRKVRGYRKNIRRLPKWTRVSQRLNPPGY